MKYSGTEYDSEKKTQATQEHFIISFIFSLQY